SFVVVSSWKTGITRRGQAAGGSPLCHRPRRGRADRTGPAWSRRQACACSRSTHIEGSTSTCLGAIFARTDIPRAVSHVRIPSRERSRRRRRAHACTPPRRRPSALPAGKAPRVSLSSVGNTPSPLHQGASGSRPWSRVPPSRAGPTKHACSHLP
ncbi:unnamed protein product, partial [Ectocarpus sp. 4 AP-2014]